MRARPWLLLALLAASASPAVSASRTIELILDASGSMNATLPSGETRLAAAKAAVAKIVPTLPGDTTLAFRAYGFQSPRDKHDCDDTALLVPFAAASGNGATVVKAARLLTAQGYTPISRVIRQAAADLATTESGTERVILLVSDGKETCDTDPCATARALKAADASLVIHAIGFEVDSGARGELQCLAAATGGTYLDASGAAGLAEAIGQASVKSMAQVPVEGKEPGNLEIKNANMNGHHVLDAVTGAKVGDISSFQRVIRVPPGIYNIAFGKSLWRGVEVHSKGSTVLDPAVLDIENAAMNGNKVLDSETGAEIVELSSFTHSAALVPGLYDVTFGGTTWRNLRLDGGQKTTLHPGVVVIENAAPSGNKIFDASGKEVAEPSSFGNSVALVPGAYTVLLAGTPKAIVLAEGQRLVLQVPK
jgi:hypothetical protein